MQRIYTCARAYRSRVQVMHTEVIQTRHSLRTSNRTCMRTCIHAYMHTKVQAHTLICHSCCMLTHRGGMQSNQAGTDSIPHVCIYVCINIICTCCRILRAWQLTPAIGRAWRRSESTFLNIPNLTRCRNIHTKSCLCNISCTVIAHSLTEIIGVFVRVCVVCMPWS